MLLCRWGTGSPGSPLRGSLRLAELGLLTAPPTGLAVPAQPQAPFAAPPLAKGKRESMAFGAHLSLPPARSNQHAPSAQPTSASGLHVMCRFNQMSTPCRPAQWCLTLVPCQPCLAAASQPVAAQGAWQAGHGSLRPPYSSLDTAHAPATAQHIKTCELAKCSAVLLHNLEAAHACCRCWV